MHHSRIFRKLALLSLVLLFPLSISINRAAAQSRKTATRVAEFDAFAAFTGVDNNFTPPLANFGVTLGGDYTQFITRFHGLITPSFQIRGTLTPGGSVGLSSLQGGFKIASTYHHLHPYGDVLVGDGVLTYPRPAVPDPANKYRDTSFLYTYGGGLTYDLGLSHFSLMADFQHQYYDLGQHPPLRFYPKAYSLGVVYHIPFKAFKTH